MFGFHLCHLATGEVKHLLTEELENYHIVLAKALTGAARSNNIADKCGPVFRPLLLQDLNTKTSSNTWHKPEERLQTFSLQSSNIHTHHYVMWHLLRFVNLWLWISNVLRKSSQTNLTCTNIMLSFPMYTFSFWKEAEHSIKQTARQKPQEDGKQNKWKFTDLNIGCIWWCLDNEAHDILFNAWNKTDQWRASMRTVRQHKPHELSIRMKEAHLRGLVICSSASAY